MTNDTTALQERIEREIFLSERWDWYDDRPDIKRTPEGDREQREKMAALWDADVRKPLHESVWPGFRQTYSRRAAAVLPIIAAEVQAASEKAWEEGWEDRNTPDGYAWDGEQDVPLTSSRYDNPYCATEYETGERA